MCHTWAVCCENVSFELKVNANTEIVRNHEIIFVQTNPMRNTWRPKRCCCACLGATFESAQRSAAIFSSHVDTDLMKPFKQCYTCQTGCYCLISVTNFLLHDIQIQQHKQLLNSCLSVLQFAKVSYVSFHCYLITPSEVWLSQHFWLSDARGLALLKKWRVLCRKWWVTMHHTGISEWFEERDLN